MTDTYNVDFKAALKSGDYDFVDFGCSTGGSLILGKEMFGAKRGLGVDIDPKKVAKTREAGFDAMQADITKIGLSRHKVRFTILSHFLEHIPDMKLATYCIQSAALISKNFIYIQQPYFDADPYLFRHGLKLFWSDWHGHPNRMTSLEFFTFLRTLRGKGYVKDFAIYGYREIKDSQDTVVHPVESPEDQSSFDPKKHPQKKKKTIKFAFPIFHEIRVIAIMPESDETLDDVLGQVKISDILYDSRSSALQEPGYLKAQVG